MANLARLTTTSTDHRLVHLWTFSPASYIFGLSAFDLFFRPRLDRGVHFELQRIPAARVIVRCEYRLGTTFPIPTGLYASHRATRAYTSILLLLFATFAARPSELDWMADTSSPSPGVILRVQVVIG
jgi:hypothetical protein